MRSILAILALVMINSLFAQDTAKFSGIVLDSLTGAAVRWAHVQFNETKLGTITNAEGTFSLSLPNDSPTKVIISCIGYKTTSVVLYNNVSKVVLLQESTNVLSEVVIKPMDVREIIREAIRRIPENYPAYPTKLTGFYRESLRYESNRYVYIAEGVIQARKEPYSKRYTNGQVKLLKSRKKEFRDSLGTLSKMRFYAGSHSAHTGDFVLNRKEFIDEKRIHKYNYAIIETIQADKREIYVISFSPNSADGFFKGVLYLDVDSKAFISAQYSLTTAGVLKSMDLFARNTRFLGAKRITNYRKIGKKWMLQNTGVESKRLFNQVKDTLLFQDEYSTTAVDTIDTAPFPYAERVQYRDIFFNIASNFDPYFWNGYITIKDISVVDRLGAREFNTLSKDHQQDIILTSKSLGQKRREKLVKIFSKLSMDLGIVNFSPSISASKVALTGNHFTITSTLPKNLHSSLGSHIGYNYTLSKRISSSLRFEESYGGIRFRSYSFSADYLFQFRLKTRPLKFNMGLGLSENRVTSIIGTINDELLLDLTGKIQVALRHKIFGIRPGIKTSLELNRRFDLFLMMNYFIPIRSRSQILFEEMDGFFLTRSKIFVKADDSRFTLEVDGINKNSVPLSVKNYFVQAGITWRYLR